MSHENSAHVIQRELASEYGRYVDKKTNSGFISFFIKALAFPLIAMLLVLTASAFAIANLSPAMYTQAKDTIFSTLDFEPLTGQPNSVSKELLDSWLILNSENQPQKAIVEEEKMLEEKTETPTN